MESIDANRRRGGLRIIADLLESMHQPVKLTHLLYKTNLSYSQLRRYLDLLLELELIQEFPKPNRSFVITDKGRTFGYIVAPLSKNGRIELSVSNNWLA